MTVLETGASPPFQTETLPPSRILILGGDPPDGPRHIWWNFVSSSRERIEDAKRDWRENRFPVVPGDESERAKRPS